MEEVALNEQVTAACLTLPVWMPSTLSLQLSPAYSCCLAAVQGPQACCVCLRNVLGNVP